MMSENTTIRNQKSYNKIKKLVLNWIETDEYKNNGVNIAELSSQLGINRTYLSNYINDTYNTNFNGWINDMRINCAMKLMLENPDIPLWKVANEVGYSDLAHFSKQFKLINSISPSKWRQKNL